MARGGGGLQPHASTVNAGNLYRALQNKATEISHTMARHKRGPRHPPPHHPLSEEVGGAVEGDLGVRVGVQGAVAEQRRGVQLPKSSRCCCPRAWLTSPGSASRLSPNASILLSRAPSRFSRSSLRSCSSETMSYMMFWV